MSDSRDLTENPFADPSIQQATRGSVPPTIDEYNPFADNSRRGQTMRGTNNPPLQPGGVQSIGQIPVSGQTATINPTRIVNSDDLVRRQEELERKAEEIRRREEELNRHSTNARAHNWPPLPNWFPVQPCFYQDINIEIPEQFQKLVRLAYYLWLIYALTLITNVFGALSLLVASGDGAMFGLSILQCALFTPCSFVMWFRPLYKAFKNDSSFNFMVFFFVMFLQLIFVTIQTLGISSFGTCGWINTLTEIGRHVGAGLIMLIAAAGFTFSGVCMLMLLFRVHNLYRASGASLAKAQQEFSRGVVNNEHVQQAAVHAASAAVRTQMPGSGMSQRY